MSIVWDAINPFAPVTSTHSPGHILQDGVDILVAKAGPDERSKRQGSTSAACDVYKFRATQRVLIRAPSTDQSLPSQTR